MVYYQVTFNTIGSKERESIELVAESQLAEFIEGKVIYECLEMSAEEFLWVAAMDEKDKSLDFMLKDVDME